MKCSHVSNINDLLGPLNKQKTIFLFYKNKVVLVSELDYILQYKVQETAPTVLWVKLYVQGLI